MKHLALCALAAVLGLPAASQATAEASPALDLWVVAEVEVETVNASGEPEIVRVEAARVVPGDEVIYTITCVNLGNENAESVFITNPVPEHMLYVGSTAETEGATVLFSVDGGSTYGAADDLTVVGRDGRPRRAVEADYTHIRWTLHEPIAPEERREVTFRAVLE